MFKDQVGREFQAEPIFELDDQINRVCRIETQLGELCFRIDGLLRKVEGPCQVFDAPIPYSGFAWIFRPQ